MIIGYKCNVILDEYICGIVSKIIKEVVMYYDLLLYNIYVNYLLMDG